MKLNYHYTMSFLLGYLLAKFVALGEWLPSAVALLGIILTAIHAVDER